jgi:hypothetical protein
MHYLVRSTSIEHYGSAKVIEYALRVKLPGSASNITNSGSISDRNSSLNLILFLQDISIQHYILENILL